MNEKDIDNINCLTEDKVRQKARLILMDIQYELEKKIKKLKPDKFIPYVADYFDKLPPDIVIAPHTILQMAEANCAYYKSGYDEDITWDKFAKIIDLNRSLEDENLFYIWSVHNNTNLFFQFIRRTQFEAQKTGFDKLSLSRYWKLFYDNDYTPKLFNKFSEKFGLSIEKWFLCSICIYAVFYKSCISHSNIKVPPGINVNNNDISHYLDHSVYSVKDIKENYFSVRKDILREFHFLIRSSFIERPIVKLDDGRIVAPIPKLIYRHMGSNLRTMLESIDNNGHCIADSFEKYIEMVLRNLSSLIELYSSNELEKLFYPDKSCDFLLITPTENILIECKAVDYRVRTLTEDAICNCNAFTKIQKAIGQINSTLKIIQTKTIKGLDKTKPFLKIIVTFGEMPGFNSDWVINKLLSKCAIDLNNASKPMIISIESLEKLIIYIENSGKSLIDIYNYKQEQNYFMTGDWDAFLTNKVRELDKKKQLNFVKKTLYEVYEKLGINIDKIPH